MAYINSCLELLGFTDIKDVSFETLKKAFKTTVLKAHPDKGGNADDFDEILSAYVFLLETIQRMYGGRNELLNIISPDELKEGREKWAVELNEAIDDIIAEFNREKFNEQFEATYKRVNNGYENWLKNSVEDTNLISGKYGDATQKEPSFSSSELNDIFIKKIKEGKPEPTSIILHPEAMAYNSYTNIGTTIIEQTTGPYTSNINENPEYCDVYSAYTSDNTIYDKVTNYSSSKTLDDIIKEREVAIKPLDDNELKAIMEFEECKKENETKHMNNIKSYFNNTGSEILIENSEVDNNKNNKNNNDGFIINI